MKTLKEYQQQGYVKQEKHTVKKWNSKVFSRNHETHISRRLIPSTIPAVLKALPSAHKHTHYTKTRQRNMKRGTKHHRENQLAECYRVGDTFSSLRSKKAMNSSFFFV